MTLPGGPADKLGNRYEEWWTVSELVRMLHGETESIRIEDPGVEKAEFVVVLASHRELHQAKRSHPSGKWSLAALGATDNGLLQLIGRQLAGNGDRFVFASSSDAAQLRDLCETASGAESIEEFEREFLSVDRRKGSERLQDCWACDVPTAFDLLRRIDVQTIDEDELKEKLQWGVEALFLADPQKVLAELRAIVRDSVHRTITRQGLVEALDQRGYRLRRPINRPQAGAAIDAATDRYLEGARRKLIQQRLLPRPSTAKLLSRLEGVATDSVLTGGAGYGKTACVVEVVESVRENGLPVFAFRLDQALSLSTTTELGQRFDLQESPVLVLAAAAEVAGCPGVLIVDQLDAVSTMSGRSSEAFDLVERLLREARGTRPRAVIHTVVVCRAFDWRNDSRLRRLMPDEHAQVEVIEFTVDEVKDLLAGAGFEPTWFQTRQLELLRIPQNLSLFLEAGFDKRREPAFHTATDLFSRYWDEKRRLVSARTVPTSDQWMQVVESLCDEMTSTQQLSVAKERLDKIPTTYLDQLASEGVVTFDGRRYGFGHESFFDYCFARVFFNRTDSLVSFLKGSEQHLFRRAQVRQVLAYLRDRDSTRYVQEFHQLLSDEAVRVHLKDLAFALLAEIEDPTEEEWTIWQKRITPALRAIEEGEPNTDKPSALAWRRFFASRSWFQFIDGRGVVERWLSSGNKGLEDTAVTYLRLHHRHSADRAAALLEPYTDCGGRWNERLQFFMEWADHHSSRRLFDLFLRLIDNGTLDDARGPMATNSTFWDIVYDLRQQRLEWVPEVVAHRLRRRVAVTRAAETNLGGTDLIGYDRAAAEMFGSSAEHAPAKFIEHLLPVVLEVSDAAVYYDDQRPKRDAVWQTLVREEHPVGEGACLLALSRALCVLARQDNTDLRDVIAELRCRETHVANHLLFALYAGGAARYADEVVSLLCEDPWRFRCGYSNSENWCAMELIRAVIPHCTATSRERLETLILGYVSPFESSAAGYKYSGRTRFSLLSAIPEQLRSRRGNAHFKELARKFGKPVGAPRGVTGGFVRSPIDKLAAHKMTDEQWLGAIVKYSSGTDWSFEGLKGGADQLAGVLGARVEEEPDRFARLSLRFPVDANSVYLERTLVALTSAAVASELKLQVCRKAFEDSRGPCGRSIAAVLGSIEDPLPDDAVQMLHWLATKDEDPVRERWQEAIDGGRTYHDGDIETNGINSTRGRAVLAIRDLILHDRTYIDRFRPTLDLMIKDPSASVLSCVAGTLRVVFYRDAAFGVSLFLRMNLSEDRLLGTSDVYEFIRGGLRESFSELRPMVERMIGSSIPEVCEAGGRLGSLAALQHDGATDLVDEALRGGGHQPECASRLRLGVAQVASANIAVPEFRAWSETALIELFNDDDADVRREAASCFRHFGKEAPEIYGDLIGAFCESRAYQEDSFSVLHMLDTSLGRLPGMTCVVCEKFLDRFAGEGRDIRSRRFGDADTVAKIIFRTYQQHQGDEWTSRSLDLIDRLCLEGVGEVARRFEEFER